MSQTRYKLELNNISLKLDSEEIISNLNLQVVENEIVSIVGASASGKSSLLRTIAGFENIYSGRILINQKIVNSSTDSIPPEKRNVGIIFQDLALFPHLTVMENIKFGLSGISKNIQTERCNNLLNILNIEDIEDKFPHQISGGQQQRVAIARAIAPKPDILLLDEPFSALDEELKDQLIKDVKSLLKKEEITAIIITHNIKEALEISDKIGFLSERKIIQYDTPYDIYHKPNTKEIANFLGQNRYINGKIVDTNHVKTQLGSFSIKDSISFKKDEIVDVMIRPDDIIHDDNSKITAKVVSKIFHGSDFLYELELPSKENILCYTPSHHDHSINELIGIKALLDHIILFKKTL